MSTSTSTSTQPSDVFKTFPEFSQLTLHDRKKFEELVHDYPPLSDLTFSTLMNWWNALDSCAVSTLNGNLIMSYWVAGMEKMSGISMMGMEQIDETICSIFDGQRAKGDEPRLVHVSEFVIERMQHPEMFRCTPERNHDEYILEIAKYYPLNRTVSFRRQRIKKFLAKTGDQEVAVRNIDLSVEENRKRLLRYAKEWSNKGIINSIAKYVDDGMAVAIEKAEHLGTEALGLYVGDRLQSFILYAPQAADKRFVVFSHALVRYEIPYTSDYMVYAFAQWFSDRGVLFVNIDSDLGIPVLRMLKLALGPVNYFRKYTIEPAGNA